MHCSCRCAVPFLAFAACLGILVNLQADDEPKSAADKKPAEAGQATQGSAVKPKPLSDSIKHGLAYLVSQQHKDGGWGQGGGWRQGAQGGRVEGANVEDPSDVADTCIATLALLRAGSTPTKGEYANNIANALEFICSHVEKADSDSLYVTNVRNTQVQGKIGPYVDTFLAGLVLAEVKGSKAEGPIAKRVDAAMGKTIAKIEKNQKADGTFAGNDGWATVFSQGLASKCLNCASQNGAVVSQAALGKAEMNAVASLDMKTRSFATGAGGMAGAGAASPVAFAGVSTRGRAGGSGLAAKAAPAALAGSASDAGVALYNISNQTQALQQAANTNLKGQAEAKKILADAKAPAAAKDKAQSDLARFDKIEEARQVAVEATVKNLNDASFLQGFGSNGGEEFLSYLNISETLVVKGDKDWLAWDKKMADNLGRVQNKDGSWSGDHCITGRTFCSATALLVLMADRTPTPVATKLHEAKK
ncbi:MAG TPA: hypothetical protein VGP68_22435 [Gemmataceae bacterium]|nr:hypothetical protein [Gemmataceae bacterium]